MKKLKLPSPHATGAIRRTCTPKICKEIGL